VRRGTLAGAAAALAALVAAFAGAPAAVAVAPNPSRDLPLGPMPSACASQGRGAVCEHAALRALDRARAQTGLGPYRVPRNFTAMAPGRQWLILANLDRAAYGLPEIGGTAHALNVVARAGAQVHNDPDPLPLLRSLTGQQLLAFGSDWAGGQPNALVAYFGWMYDDGYGSNNVDCARPSDPGCWGHRRNILAFPHAPALTMGAAALTPGASYALTIVESSTPPWPYAFRWRR
jgi:hypothetical protein